MNGNKNPSDESMSTDPLLVSKENGEDTPYDINDLITKAGGFGRLQWLLLVFTMLTYQGINFFIYNLAFLELMPKLNCRPTPDTGFLPCSDPSDICLKGKIIDRQLWEIDFSHPESFNNWMTELELFCTDGFLIGLLGSMYFLGFAMNGLILKQSDRFGRKKIIIVGCFMQIAV